MAAWVLSLQRSVGNQAVTALVPSISETVIQRKIAKATDGNGPIAEIADSGLTGNEAAAAKQALGYIDAGTALVDQDWAKEKITANGGKVPNSLKKFKWAVAHGNRDGDLPGVKGAGGYLEYYLRKGDDNAAALSDVCRLVISTSTGDVFHTATHYGRDGSPAFTHYRAKK
jgi:hypothetical protein